MADVHDNEALCASCKALTLIMLRDGYQHPLTYKETVLSGQTSRLCRLIVCSVGKLQTPLNSRGIEARYMSLAEKLPQLPAVSRRHVPGMAPLGLVEMSGLVGELNWSRDEYSHSYRNEREIQKGNFNQGETIQITSPSTSLYRSCGLVPLRDIEPASSTRNYQLLREWLSTCISKHENCRLLSTMCCGGIELETTALPTRVVDVGTPSGLEQGARLLVTGGLMGQYVCLSHRWGKGVAMQTRSATLEAYQAALPTNSMPVTFRDAVEVTRRLGFRYLWIDSLCIVQDDKEDWARESRNMGTIFEGAVCTIAAVDALDADDTDRGLFWSGDLDTLAVKLTLPYDKVPLIVLSQLVFKTNVSIYVWKYRWLRPDTKSKDYPESAITLRARIISAWKRLLRSQWHNRGWVLQERLLSHRLIYYTKDKLSWDCFSSTGEEEGGDPHEPTRSSLLTRRQVPVSAIWRYIVSEYQNCNLTYNADRLAALSGISTKLETRFACTIHAGIVHGSSRETSETLLWYAKNAPLRAFDDFHAPSWSWAASHGPLSFYMKPPNSTEEYLLIGDVKFETRVECEYRNPFGKCRDSCVSGSVSFVAPAGILYRRMLLKDLRVEGYPDEPITDSNILAKILGTSLTAQFTIPRFDQEWNEVRRPYNLMVPDHTEILMDGCGCYLGFLIPDRKDETENVQDISPIVCASIRRWGSPESVLQSRNEGREEETIDFIGLEDVCHSENVYRRVGRGRVICNSWLQGCRELAIKII